MKKIGGTLIVFVLTAVLLLGSSFNTLLYTDGSEDLSPQEITPSFEPLPVVGTTDKLKELLQQAAASTHLPMVAADMMTGTAEAVKSVAPQAKNEVRAESNYSATNLQVDGVDEADIVKTDGKFIYEVTQQKVVIAEAYPADKMNVSGIIDFAGKEFNPRELYVNNDYLIVIGEHYFPIPLRQEQPTDVIQEQPMIKGKERLEIYPPVARQITSKAIVYDISDRKNPKELREAELDGYYLSSRMIDSSLYLVANKMIQPYWIMNEGNSIKEGKNDPPTPSYRDSAVSDDFIPIKCEEIHYFPDSPEPNYLLIASLNLKQMDQKMQVNSYLGSGQNVYSSLNNLYVAVSQMEKADLPVANTLPAAPDSTVSSLPAVSSEQPVSSNNSAVNKSIAAPPSEPYMPKFSTVIYKFALNNGLTTYNGKGEVPGNILNQFSMDEYQGFFRIATTEGPVWQRGKNTLSNNVYILDSNLKITGQIENVAPGENIHSVRFMGDRGYMVTFKTVDPFFVIDLKNPQEPKILGELKIPGYSDYLQPYDENHIIGIGKETIEINNTKAPENALPQTRAFYLGMKLAIFDVSDVQHPIEQFKTAIGGRGTDSEILRNHKALLFDKEKGILAFPVAVMEVKGEQFSPDGFPMYGEFTFQGAYVYHINLTDGFTLKGKITHLDNAVLDNYHHKNLDSNKMIERILYINDTLYTLSKEKIQANDLNSMNKIKQLIIPE